VVEYLQGIRGRLPEGSNPTIGPDATGVGWVFQYALVDDSGQHDLGELRGVQDWFLRYALASVDGVAEVASIGGFVKQHQERQHCRSASITAAISRIHSPGGQVNR